MNILVTWLVLGLSLISVTSEQPSCKNQTNSCNEYTPCCNEGGWCGQGFSYCGQTCFEKGNFKGQKCLPQASCESKKYTLSDDNIIHDDEYSKTGDFLKYDFRIRGDYEIQGDEIVLKMNKPNSGSTLQSTRYINYGRVSVDTKTARGKGIVSSFITMSDSKDEIDFEWVGKSTTEFQSNWFSEGVFPVWPDTHTQTHNQTDSFAQFHRYTIDWDETRIQWLIDGKLVREFKKTDDDYPSTPSLFSFGLWDGSSGADGTREWAGGYVDWNGPDMKDPGYYSVRVKNIEVECYGEATSQDKDFVVDPKLGLILKKDQKKISSLDPNRAAGAGHFSYPSLAFPLTILITLLFHR